MHKAKRQQKNRDTCHLGDNLGQLKVRNSLPLDIIGQTGLGGVRIFRLDGLKDPPVPLSALSFDLLAQNQHDK